MDNAEQIIQVVFLVIFISDFMAASSDDLMRYLSVRRSIGCTVFEMATKKPPWYVIYILIYDTYHQKYGKLYTNNNIFITNGVIWFVKKN